MYIADVWNIEEKGLPRKGVSAYEMIEKFMTVKLKGCFWYVQIQPFQIQTLILLRRLLKSLNF